VTAIVGADSEEIKVLCIAPTGYRKLCTTKEQLEQFLSAYPACVLKFGEEARDDKH
jgi:hypothetical protein